MNIKKAEFRDLVDRRLYDSVKKLSGVEGDINFTFKLVIPPIPPMSVDSRKSYTLPAVVNVIAQDLVTGEKVNTSVKVMDIPIYSELGLILDGTSYEVLTTSTRASGWSLAEGKPIKKPDGQPAYVPKELVMSCSTASKLMFNTEEDDKGITVSYRKYKVPLYTFILGATSLVEDDIPLRIGQFDILESSVEKNRPESPSLYKDLAISEVYTLLFGKESKEADSTLTKDEKVKGIRKFLYGEGAVTIKSRKLKFDDAYRDSTNQCKSFSKVIGKELAESVLDYKEGTEITEEIANHLDGSDIEQIEIISDGKRFLVCNYKDNRDEKEVNITEGELLSVINSFLLYINGMASSSKREEFYNMKFSSYADTVISYFEEYLNECIELFIQEKAKQKSIEEISIIANKDKDSYLEEDTSYMLKACSKFRSYLYGGNSRNLISDIKVAMRNSLQFDKLNTPGEVTKKYKIVSSLSSNAGIESRLVTDSNFPFVDGFNQSESQNVGNQFVATFMTMIKDNNLQAPLVNFSELLSSLKEDGDEALVYYEYFTPRQLKGKSIADWRVDSNAKSMLALKDGEIVELALEDIDYILPSPWSITSVGSGDIVFIQNITGKRIVMACNQVSQKMVTFGGTVSTVTTGQQGAHSIGITKAKELIMDAIDSDVMFRDQILKIQGIDASRLSKNTNVEEREAIINDLYNNASNMELTIIKTTNHHNYKEITFSTKYKGTVVTFKHKMIFNMRTEEGTVKSRTINNNLKVYKGEDIVLANHDIQVGNFDYYTGHLEVTNAKDMIIPQPAGGAVKRYNPNTFTDFGYFTPDVNLYKSDFKSGMALRVCYKINDSTSIEDSGSISSELLTDDIATSLVMHDIQVPKLKQDPKDKREFQFVKGEVTVDIERSDENYIFGDQAFPKVGEYIEPNTIFMTSVTSLDEGSSTFKRRTPYSTKSEESGYVQRIVDTDSEFYHIILMDTATITSGDKVAGRHGNKGVISKIIPEEDMPWNPETGKPYQIILNPLGVPSRMNGGQLQETSLGFALDRIGFTELQKDNIRIMLSQFNPDAEDILENIGYVRESSKKIIDGRTGLEFDEEIETGVIYISKLEHMVNTKVHQVEIPTKLNPITDRPSKGKSRQGGKKIGEMERGAIQYRNEGDLIDALYQTDLSTEESRNSIYNAMLHDNGEGSVAQLKSTIETGDLNSLRYDCGNKRHFALYTYHHGIAASTVEVDEEYQLGAFKDELTKKEQLDVIARDGLIAMQFKPLTDETLIKIVGREAINADGVTNIEARLQDPKLFGSDKKDPVKFRNQWDMIKINTETGIPNPVIVEKGHIFSLIPSKIIKSRKVEGKVTYYLPKDYKRLPNGFGKYLMSGTHELYYNDDNVYVIMEKLKKSTKGKKKDEIEYLLNTGFKVKSGLEGVIHVLHNTTIDFALNSLDKIDDSYKALNLELIGNRFENQYAKLRLDSMKHYNIEFKDYLSKYYPVCPLSYRYLNPTAERKEESLFDTAYKAIAKKSTSEGSAYAEIEKFLLLSDRVAKNIPESERSKTFAKFIDKDNDKGFLRAEVASTRLPFSGSSVIASSDSYDISLFHIGIPLTQMLGSFLKTSTEMLSGDDVSEFNKTRYQEYRDALNDYGFTNKEIIGKLLKAVQGDNRTKVLRLIDKVYHNIKDELKEGFDSRKEFFEHAYREIDAILFNYMSKFAEMLMVLAGRNPTLHVGSVMGFKPMVVRGKALRLNSLTCTAYNADFDGDQMWFAFQIAKEAQLSVERSYMVDSNFQDYANGKKLFLPNQDVQLGCYNFTTLCNNSASILPVSHIYIKGHEQKVTKENEGLDIYRGIWEYSDLDKLMEDVKVRSIHQYELISFTHSSGRKYLSTAGRIIINSLLSEGSGFTEYTMAHKEGDNIVIDNDPNYLNDFNKTPGYSSIDLTKYYQLRHDGIIGKNANKFVYQNILPSGKLSEKKTLQYISLEKFLEFNISNFGIKATTDVISAIQKLGFTFVDSCGSSLLLKDYVIPKNKKRYLENLDSLRKELALDVKKGLMLEEDVDEVLYRFNSEFKKLIYEDIEKEYPRSNSFWKIVDSGSKGSFGELLQSVGLIGPVNTGSKFSKTSINESYREGLTPLEMHLATKPIRISFTKQQIEIKRSGYFTRLIEMMVECMKVNSHDCGVKPEDSIVPAIFGDVKRMSLNHVYGNTLKDLTPTNISGITVIKEYKAIDELFRLYKEEALTPQEIEEVKSKESHVVNNMTLKSQIEMINDKIKDLEAKGKRTSKEVDVEELNKTKEELTSQLVEEDLSDDILSKVSECYFKARHTYDKLKSIRYKEVGYGVTPSSDFNLTLETKAIETINGTNVYVDINPPYYYFQDSRTIDSLEISNYIVASDEIIWLEGDTLIIPNSKVYQFMSLVNDKKFISNYREQVNGIMLDSYGDEVTPTTVTVGGTEYKVHISLDLEDNEIIDSYLSSEDKELVSRCCNMLKDLIQPDEVKHQKVNGVETKLPELVYDEVTEVGIITEQVLKTAKLRKVPQIVTSGFVVTMVYKATRRSNSSMENSVFNGVLIKDNLVDVMEYSSERYKILNKNYVYLYDKIPNHTRLLDSDSSKFVEKYNFRNISFRTPRRCREEFGVCATCYGTVYNSYTIDKHGVKLLLTFPELGNNVGILVSTSLGEAITQALLNSVNNSNQGGSNSVDPTPFVQGNKEKVDHSGIIAPAVTTVNIDVVKNFGKLTYEDIVIKEDKKADGSPKLTYSTSPVYTRHPNNIYPSQGEVVQRFDKLIRGHCTMDSIIYNYKDITELKEIFEHKVDGVYDNLAEILCPDNGKYIDGTHLELIARVQSSVMKVVTDFKGGYEPKGGTYTSAQQVLNHLHLVESGYAFTEISGPRHVSRVFGDKVKEISFESRPEFMSRCLTEVTPFFIRSPLGATIAGIPIDKERRRLTQIKADNYLTFPEETKFKQNTRQVKSVEEKGFNASASLFDFISDINPIVLPNEEVDSEVAITSSTPTEGLTEPPMILGCKDTISIYIGDSITKELFDIELLEGELTGIKLLGSYSTGEKGIYKVKLVALVGDQESSPEDVTIQVNENLDAEVISTEDTLDVTTFELKPIQMLNGEELPNTSVVDHDEIAAIPSGETPTSSGVFAINYKFTYNNTEYTVPVEVTVKASDLSSIKLD